MLKVMISVGEASGDMHGANVATALKTARPGIHVFGMGGDLMRAAGVEIIHDIKDLGVFGLVEIVKKLPKQIGLRRSFAELMDRERPDVLVIIDYYGFNIPLAKVAKAKGIPVVYYIPPKVWAWGHWRAKGIAEAVEQIIVMFPFETDIYREAGANVVYVGNPLVDIARPSIDKNEAYRLFAADPDKPIVLLMPGSRVQEISKLLPPMLAAAKMITEKVPDCQFYLPVASTISREILQNIIKGYNVPVRLTSGDTYDLMQISDIAIAASGTATLETSLLGVPTVIIYKVAGLTYFIGKLLLKTPYVGLPNIVAGRKIVPELLQHEATPENIAQEAVAILTDSALHRHILEELDEVKQKIGEGGAIGRVANVILEVAAANRVED